MRNDELRKSLRRLPAGRYNMADMEFSIREIKPEQSPEEPLIFSEYDLLCAAGMGVLTSEVQS